MNIDEAFPSKYISAADLQGRDVIVRIARITVEQLGRNNDPKDNKPILYFQGKQKGLALNKTNANTVKDMYGKETDAWIGQTITLVTAWTDYAGKQVECIRVRPPRANGAAPQQVPPPARPPQQTAVDPFPPPTPRQIANAGLDDEIPF